MLLFAPAVSFAQEVCPDTHPVDCGTGSCCPAGHYCSPGGGCVPYGWSDCGGGVICPPGTNITCPGFQMCYPSHDAAIADGCSFEASIICSVPAQ